MQPTRSLQDSQEGGSSATHHHHHPLSPPPTTTRTTPTKRPFSPSCASPSPRKSLKKSPSPTTTTTTTSITHGFSKITLPITFPSLSSPLHRTLSEPISSFNPSNTPVSPFSATSHSSTSSAHFLNPHLQQTTTNKNSPSPPSSSKTLHKLLRSVSDPTTLSFGPQSAETPTSKRLEEMKGIVKGINQLSLEVIYEDENENKDVSNEDLHKDCSDSKIHDHTGEEVVSVEKKGDCLVFHFKCPCGSGYEIVLFGKDCYYKLT